MYVAPLSYLAAYVQNLMDFKPPLPARHRARKSYWYTATDTQQKPQVAINAHAGALFAIVTDLAASRPAAAPVVSSSPTPAPVRPAFPLSH